MIDLERSLTELADRLEIPGGAWLVDDVVRRIGEPQPRRTRRAVFALATAAAVLGVILLVALPGPRHVVARWLGFDSVHIEPGVTISTTAAPTTTSPVSMPVATSERATTTVAEPDLGLGSVVSMADATSRTGLPDPSPALLGQPQSVHVVQPPRSGQIVAVYPPSELVPQSPITGVGALVSVFPARIDAGFFSKTLGDSATVQPVDVGGADGYWIEGAPHQLLFVFGGEAQTDTLRLATNTLLWQRGDNVYRLEADISLDTALRIAASIS